MDEARAGERAAREAAANARAETVAAERRAREERARFAYVADVASAARAATRALFDALETRAAEVRRREGDDVGGG